MKTRLGVPNRGTRHGLLTDGSGGTRANLPVLYAAVGRRLGYPIYLVPTRGHLFNRWHNARTGERFNVDGAGHGLSTHSDAFYYDWPEKIAAEEVAHGIYLRSLDPVEELGQFMLTRGHCLEAKGHLLDAIVAYGHAHRLWPLNPSCLAFLLRSLNRELDLQDTRKWPVTYRQLENWDKEIGLKRFTLDSRYGERVSRSKTLLPGVDEVSQGQGGL